MTDTTYYKWLDGRKSCNGGDAAWRKGAWKTVKGPLEPCRNGLHLCRPEHLLSRGPWRSLILRARRAVVEGRA